jgi:hypothetical protein
MLEDKSEPNNGWGNYMAQRLSNGNFFRAFPIKSELSESEVRTW